MPELYLKGSDELAWEMMDNGMSDASYEYFYGQIENIQRVISWFNKRFEWRDDFNIKKYYFMFEKTNDKTIQKCNFLAEDTFGNLVEYPLSRSNFYYDPSVYHDTYYSKVADGLYDNLGNKIE